MTKSTEYTIIEGEPFAMLDEAQADRMDIRDLQRQIRNFMDDRMRLIAELHDAERALMWCLDRLAIDGGMNERQQIRTAIEIIEVLLKHPSVASRYQPNEWSDSAKIQGGDLAPLDDLVRRLETTI
jgi:hypothetical protein